MGTRTLGFAVWVIGAALCAGRARLLLVAADCNANGVEDAAEIARGDARDCDGNGVPDECDVSSSPLSFAAPLSYLPGAALGTGGFALSLIGGMVNVLSAGVPDFWRAFAGSERGPVPGFGHAVCSSYRIRRSALRDRRR